jgi:hypothetical protein
VRAALVTFVLLLIAGCRSAPQAPVSAPPPPPSCSIRLGYLGADGVYYLLDYVALDVLAPQAPVPRPAVRDVAGWVRYSTDGRRLVYLGRDDQVHFADLATGADRVVGLSPDGARVAFVEKGAVRVWKASSPAGSPGAKVRRPKPPTYLAWSPDSATLAMGTMAQPDDETNDGGIWLLQGAASQPKRTVAPGPRGDGCSRELQWSPDGKWLAWARGYGDAWTGDLARADGSDLRRDALGAGPREWLPDSRGLIVDIHIEAGAFRAGLYTLRTNKVVPFVGGVTLGHCLSPDGEAVLVLEAGGSSAGQMIDLGSGVGSPWGPDAVIEGAAWLAEGLVPKDERRFPWRIAAAVRDPQTQGLRLWFLDRSGGGKKETTLSLDPEFGPSSLRWIDLP